MSRSTALNPNVFLNFILAVTALYFGRDVFIPLALSGLLSFLLVPIVTRIEKRGIGRVTAVVVTTLLAFSAIGGIGWIAASQVSDLSTNAAQYQENLKAKVQEIKLKSADSFSFVNRMMGEIRSSLNTEVTQKSTGTPLAGAADKKATSPGMSSDAPVWSRIVEPQPTPVELLRSSIDPILGPLGTFGIVIVLSIFIMIHREDLRDRVIRLMGEGRLNVTTDALDESGSKVGTYLLMQLMVNVSYGIPVYLALYLIGVPNSVLWGVMSTLLRFVPYLGPWIAAAFPVALSFAISTSWSLPLYTIGVFLVLEFISNNIIEPWLYGKNTGLSPVAIMVAAIFWTWVWGTVGLLLSTPLTVCFVVLGKYLPQLRFLTLLLGDAPALEPKTRVYQRLLADDYDEAFSLVSKLTSESSRQTVIETTLVPALEILQRDRQTGGLDDTKYALVVQGFRSLLEDTEPKMPSEGMNQQTKVFCLPAGSESDELCAIMLSQILKEKGTTVKVLPHTSLANEMVDSTNGSESPIIVISALPPSASLHARYMMKRLESGHPDVRVIVGLWNSDTNVKIDKEALKQKMPSNLPFSLASTVSEAAILVRELQSVTDKL